MAKKAGIVLINSKNMILVVKGRESKKWSIPKGHKEDKDGDIFNTGKREFKEETGRILCGSEQQISIFKHKKEQYFVMRINHEDLPCDTENIDTVEIMNIAWFPPEKLKKMRINSGLDCLLTFLYSIEWRIKEDTSEWHIVKRKK